MKKKEPMKWNGTAGYLHTALSTKHRKVALSGARKVLKNASFDAIAVTGVSGVVFGAVLAHLMNKPLVVVRKSGELPRSHSWEAVEGPDHIDSYLIVDDLVDSGDTVRRIREDVEKTYPNAKCVGIHCYHQTPTSASVSGLHVFPRA